ncbi:5-oxoprolinase/urea amidolyase family protein [Microbacterium sp. dk485]|uniref:5-oxoprolinase subunit B/C family protein n=1 Tax=Microbacterium TaxID=33882 RepID=UPI00107456A0|nr:MULTISPECIES: urea amidolyase family protein [Microbacterium]TFV84239.1 5-oxoprolinase/urea amidolyase family protein [Microbacterium sp. dk485]TXK15948.1 5-oxoprolinase/urea amidolyase family protein [Microbacterium wangchenii]
MVSALLRPMGERAVLAEVESLADVLALSAALHASRPRGVVDVVPAARTVLVTFDPGVVPGSVVRAWIRSAGADAAAAARPAGPVVEVPIRYDGPDLAETADLLGMSAAELVARHRGAQWSVAFSGFAPGFGYLVSPQWAFDVPRLASPRTRVPAGAVGLAGAFSGAYPRETPGGWRLIGTTDAPLFDASADVPVLLPPGARVRFVPASPVRGETPLSVRDTGRRRVSQSESGVSAEGGLRVVEPGLLATVQDLGRPGHAALGIARSGALDRAALRRANRLVGNAEGAAGVEITMGGFRAVAGRDGWMAVAGATGPITIGGHSVDPHTAAAWPAGAELHVGPFASGARAYLAVRGGIDVAPVAGSRATDVLAGIGPAPLRAGDMLATGPTPAAPVPAADLAPWGAAADERIEVELAPGPRTDWFAASASRALFEEEWTVSAAADRVGMRLDGTELERVRGGELPSEGMIPGALQVPPSGRPTILLADGPVTGGYPVIAVATEAALDALAQARPGTRVRFRHARPLP